MTLLFVLYRYSSTVHSSSCCVFFHAPEFGRKVFQNRIVIHLLLSRTSRLFFYDPAQWDPTWEDNVQFNLLLCWLILIVPISSCNGFFQIPVVGLDKFLVYTIGHFIQPFATRGKWQKMYILKKTWVVSTNRTSCVPGIWNLNFALCIRYESVSFFLLFFLFVVLRYDVWLD